MVARWSTRDWGTWARAAVVRAVKTAAQAALGLAGAATVLGDVEWALVGGGAGLAAVLSLFTSLAGLPEEEPT